MGYVYDNLGQLIQIKYPDLSGQIYDVGYSPNLTVFNYYDSKGSLKRTIDRKGQTINCKYNEYNQLIKTDLPVSEDIDYYYNELGQLIKVKQGNKFEKFYTYDARGRLTKEKLTVDPSLGTEKEYVTEYDYNKNNALTGMVYPDAAGTLSYGYNTLNQINHVTWKGSDLVKSVEYANTGHLEKLTYGNGVEGEFNYDYVNGQYVPNNIAYMQGTKQLGVYDYRYDKLGNIIRANNHQYEYDDLNQLTGWKFLQENDKVLLGEEVIWDKEMTDGQNLSLDKTNVMENQLQLDFKDDQNIVHVGDLLDSDEVTSSSSLKINSVHGYELYRNPWEHNESFTSSNNLNLSITKAKIDYSLGTVKLPAINVFESIYDNQTEYKLPASIINDVVGSISPVTTFSGYDYRLLDDLPPSVDDSKWHPVSSSVYISPDNVFNVKDIELKVKSFLNHDEFDPSKEWKLWLKLEINDVYVGMQSFSLSNTSSKTIWQLDNYNSGLNITKILNVDLSDYGLVNSLSGLRVKMYWLVNKWSFRFTTISGEIKAWTVTANGKNIYSANQEKYKSYQLPALSTGIRYKLETNQVIPSGTSVRYELWNSSSKKSTLSNGDIFTVPTSGTYYIRAYIKSTNSNYTPIVKKVKVSKERFDSYASSAAVQSKTFTLPEYSKQIELKYSHALPSGTRIDYLVSNNGGSTWKTVVYNSTLEKYVADFTNAGNKVIVKAILYPDSGKQNTPTLSNLWVNALDLQKYRSSGSLNTRSISISEPTNKLILELHCNKNGGSIDVSIDVNGESIAGIPTTSTELLYDYSKVDDINYTLGDGSSLQNDLAEERITLKDGLSGKNLQSYYYYFDIPEDLSSLNTKLTIKLNASADRLSTPYVYSYVLLYNWFSYNSTGTFNTENNLTLSNERLFKKMRLDVVGQNPSNTTANYMAYDFGSGQTKPLMSGETAQLGLDINKLKIQGEFTTSNKRQTPKISRMTVTAIGETPLVNDIEFLDDVDYIKKPLDTMSFSTDRVVGDTSLMLDHRTFPYNEYETNRNHVFDSTKLPIIQVWVKPLTENSEIAFATWDEVEGRSESFCNDFDGDSKFEVGEDLIANQWNLVLLDLRNTNGGGIAKDAKGLYFIVDKLGTQVLVDGVSSLPLNQVSYDYDKAGNRSEYIGNGLASTYEYEFGSNRLKRRYNQFEDIYYTYDYNGNLIRQEVTRFGDYYYFDYVYNELNQLVAIKKNGSLIAEYRYDHGGLRYKKVDNVTNKTTIYVYGTGYEPIYEEIYSNSNLSSPLSKVSYLNMGGKRIARAEGNAKWYYFTDHLGSTRIVMDESGNCTYSEYKPFGSDFVSSDERYKFTGKEDDGVTGLHYFNARYYDPAVGRFISEDPVKDGANWYGYCSNCPLTYKDRNGLQPTRHQAGTVAEFKEVMDNSTSKIGLTIGKDAEEALLRLGKTGGFMGLKPLTTPYFNQKKGRYIYTFKKGWIDMVHFLFYAGRAYTHKLQGDKNPIGEAMQEGYRQETLDIFRSNWSAYSYEDLPTDLMGATFAVGYFDVTSGLSLSEQIANFLNGFGATLPLESPNWADIPEKDSKDDPLACSYTTKPMFTK
ncbi:MAG: hypothetical protein KAX49_18130 [Halanaerobiales bacterium]|nr:hypothetical protein [Halanaerobiales bacterium]